MEDGVGEEYVGLTFVHVSQLSIPHTHRNSYVSCSEMGACIGKLVDVYY